MASYKSDVIDYVENAGGRANVSAGEVAETVGCSKDTVYRHWTEVPELIDGDGDDEPVDRTTDRETDEAGPHGDGDGDGDGDLEQGDLESEGDDDPEDSDGDDLEPDDEPAKEYECGNCGSTLEYLQKHCDDCGQKPVWSAIDG